MTPPLTPDPSAAPSSSDRNSAESNDQAGVAQAAPRSIVPYALIIASLMLWLAVAAIMITADRPGR